MGYEIKYAMGRLKNNPGIVLQLSEEETHSVSLTLLNQKYIDLFWVIEHKTLPDFGVQTLYFNELPIDYQVSSRSMDTFLVDYHNLPINFTKIVPQYYRAEVYSWDINSWGFDYHSMKLGNHPRASIPDEDKTELLITRKNTDMVHAGKHGLVSINGLFHYHEYDENGLLVVDGNTTRSKNRNQCQINLLDFTQIGELTLKPITREMIRPANQAVSLSDNVYIDVGESMSGKTVGIVIGGYFHLLDHTYKRVTDTVLKIDFNNIMWESLYYKMKDILDIRHLNITDYGDDRTTGIDLYHDETILRLLTLSQSFLVFIDNPYLSITEVQLGDMGIPKRYETATKPIYPLRIGEGRYPAYKAIKEFDRWSIAVEDNIVPRQVRYRRHRELNDIRHNRIYPIHGETYATAHFMLIQSDREILSYIIDPYFIPLPRDIGPLKPYMLDYNQPGIHHEEDLREADVYIPPKIINEDFNDIYYRTTVSWHLGE